jgi:hypothetical protein
MHRVGLATGQTIRCIASMDVADVNDTEDYLERHHIHPELNTILLAMLVCRSFNIPVDEQGIKGIIALARSVTGPGKQAELAEWTDNDSWDFIAESQNKK